MPSVDVCVIMPIRGRAAQSVDAMNRLRATAGHTADFIAVGGANERETLTAIDSSTATRLMVQAPNLTYWQALKFASDELPDSTYVVNVANDILPCANWLRYAVDRASSHPEQVIGFNGDGHGPWHACHFMISMRQLRMYGGWPTWYWHNFGDTEIVTRASEDKIFYKHPWAVLFHNHPIVSAAPNDEVYAAGQQRFNDDRQLFEQRRAAQWTS